MATATLPTIKLNMHQRTATDNERTHRHYLLIDPGMGLDSENCQRRSRTA
jgi:hypothetical protein